MTLLGKNIQLKGISQKGKNRVREYGDRWVVLAETDRILFAPGRTGPFLFITPKGKSHDDVGGRWVKAVDDDDFKVQLDD